MSRTDFTIALMPGDGIGEEVMGEGVRVLRAAEASIGGFRLQMKSLPVGALSCEIPVSATKRLGAFAEKHKLMVGYHGHGDVTNPEAFGSRSSWERAMSFSKYNGANVDTGHFYAANGFSPAKWIKENRARVTHVHLKDRKANNGPNMPWGEGGTPLTEILQLMKAEKYPFQATIEGSAIAAVSPATHGLRSSFFSGGGRLRPANAIIRPNM